MKATDQMRWVQEMNNVRACAEEIVLREVIYRWRYWTNYDTAISLLTAIAELPRKKRRSLLAPLLPITTTYPQPLTKSRRIFCKDLTIVGLNYPKSTSERFLYTHLGSVQKLCLKSCKVKQRNLFITLRRWNSKFHRRFQFLGCFLRTALYFCPFHWLPIRGTSIFKEIFVQIRKWFPTKSRE